MRQFTFLDIQFPTVTFTFFWVNITLKIPGNTPSSRHSFHYSYLYLSQVQLHTQKHHPGVKTHEITVTYPECLKFVYIWTSNGRIYLGKPRIVLLYSSTTRMTWRCYVQMSKGWVYHIAIVNFDAIIAKFCSEFPNLICNFSFYFVFSGLRFCK